MVMALLRALKAIQRLFEGFPDIASVECSQITDFQQFFHCITNAGCSGNASDAACAVRIGAYILDRFFFL
jgi:hypothetical protein